MNIRHNQQEPPFFLVFLYEMCTYSIVKELSDGEADGSWAAFAFKFGHFL